LEASPGSSAHSVPDGYADSKADERIADFLHNAAHPTVEADDGTNNG
jgi:hypothetical protein